VFCGDVPPDSVCVCGVLCVRVGCLSWCSKWQPFALVVSIALPALKCFTFCHSQTVTFGGVMVVQEKRVPDHQALHISGPLHIRPFCL
jgi:hypothetical protein